MIIKNKKGTEPSTRTSVKGGPFSNKKGTETARVSRSMKSRGPFFNKKGDIAITVLVIGVFAIASFAMISFVVSDFSYGNSFVGISVMQKANAAIDEYKFYQNNGVNLDAIKSEFDFITEDNVEYLYYEKKGSGWMGNEDTLLFSVQYPVRNSP